jgi:hypothetical protein
MYFRFSHPLPSDSEGVLESHKKGAYLMLLVLALLLVLIFFGAGFALHILWIAAVVLLVLWLVGFAMGRGENAGSHRFYRW